MIRFRWLLKPAGLLLSLAILTVACVDQPISTETVSQPAILEGTRAGVAPASPEGVAVTPLPRITTAVTPDASLVISPSTTPIDEEEKVANTPAMPTPPDPAMQRLVEQAKADLARRLSITEDRIELVSALQVDWPDTSMGCPQPGGEYLHVWVVGELIRLRAEGRVYEYHSGPNRPPFLCLPTK